MKVILKILFLLGLVGALQSQTDYSLEDINPNSNSYGDTVGTSHFENHVVIHYFGHFY
tara:strand:+ start:115 stop:288 length:174 start_codon:yes stop_codon:yes gene_type:complete